MNDQDISEDVQKDGYGALELAANKLSATANQMRLSAKIASLPPDRLTRVYYNDKIYNICFSMVEFESYQQRLLETRQPFDLTMLTQLFDLVPTLDGKEIIDVGGFTGLQGLILAHELGAGHLHVFEPQKAAQEGLRATLMANDCAEKFTLYDVVVDEADQALAIAGMPPNRLAQVHFIRRSGASYASRSLDSYGFENIGLLNLDYNASKVPALRGAEKLISEQKPVVVLDLLGRDIDEIKILMSDHGYVMQIIGRHSVIFLPE